MSFTKNQSNKGNSKFNVQGIILAAGKSERFKGRKLLTQLPNGQIVSIASAMILRDALPDVLAVILKDDKAMTDWYSQINIPSVFCQACILGLGHSIACAVKATPSADAWLIALADMPFIKTETVRAVAGALEEGALIGVPVYEGRRGHPVGFSKRLYSELVTLSGDEGARSLVTKYAVEVVEVSTEDKGILIDIDTPEDLERYSREFG